MNEDGKIVIGIITDDKDFYKKIKEIQNTKVKDIEINSDLNVEELQKKIIEAYQEIQKFRNVDIINEDELSDLQLLITYIEKANERISELGGRQIIIPGLNDANESLKDIENSAQKIDLSNVQSQLENVGNSIKRITKKVIKWGLALFGIRSAYMFIRQSMSTLSQYNDQLATDVEYIRYALANTLKPLIEGIIKLIYQLLGLINSVAKSLFGVDLFANSSAKAFGKANKSAGELKKTLAGFDEMNVLNENGSTGAIGAIAPSFDLSQDNLFDNWDLNKFIEKGKEIATNIAKGINDFFANTDWSVLGQSLSDALIGILDIIITFIKEVDWKLIGQSIADFLLSVDWVGVAIKIFELLIESMIASMYLVEGVTEKIIEKLTDPQFLEKLVKSGNTMIEKIADGASNVEMSLSKVWSNIISFFLKKLGLKDNDAEQVGEKIGDGIYNGIDFTLEHLPFFGLFYRIIKFANNAFGIHSPSKEFSNIGENLMTGLANGIKSGINGVIDIINRMINRINSALSFRWNKIEIAGIKLLDAGSINVGRIPNIPHLAKGGILNMPGRGVDYYGANIAEKAPEAVIPFTDEQVMDRLGQSIARHMVINLTNINQLNGRIISRELQRVQNNQDFAFNR